jgi:phosphatidylinositol dimannoside acyltransferase
VPTLDDSRKRITGALALGGYRVGSALAKVMPGALLGGAAAGLGAGVSVSSPQKRRLIERHLKRVNPRLRGTALRVAVQQAFDSYARYYAESFRLPNLSARTVDRAFTREGFHHVGEALAEGNGVILALPHLGGWEWAGRWMSDQGQRLTVVVEPIEPPELFEWFVNLRRDLGMNVVPLGPQAAPAILGALRANEVVCLLCDRDIERTGVEVRFFNEMTTLPAGPATLSLRTGAPVLPVATYFTPVRTDGHHAVIRPPIPSERRGNLRADVARMTQYLAHELEFLIRRAPEQWHLFQPNWPSDPGY